MLSVYQTKFTQKKNLASAVYLFKFQLIRPSSINFIPGQYMIIKIDDKSRLYSIASAANENNFLEFVIELVPFGLASEYLRKLSLGSEVLWYGPAGLFQFKDEEKDSIFLATGTGIAPIRSIIISNIKNQKTKFYLFWGLRYYRDIYFLEDLKALESKSNGRFKFIYCLSQEKDLTSIKEEDKKYFFFGHIQDGFNYYFSNSLSFSNDNFYLCGSREVVEALKKFLEEKKVKRGNIFFERF